MNAELMTDESGRKIINAWDAITLLREVATQEPADYVYERPGNGFSCVNLEKNDKGDWVGSCLVGRVWVLLGMKPDTEWVAGSASYSAQHIFDKKLNVSDDAVFVLQTAQNLQDGGMPWKHAIEAVEQAYVNLCHTKLYRDAVKAQQQTSTEA